MWYEVKWVGYKEIIWEPAKNLKNVDKKVKEYYKRAGQAKKKIRG